MRDFGSRQKATHRAGRTRDGMSVLAGAVVVFLHCCAVNVVVATCPDGWVKRNSYCYYFSTSAEKQGFAVAKCRNMSAELASIHDAEENTFVTNTTKAAGHNHWLGMQRKSENSTGKPIEWKRKDWHWYDETNLDFVNWDVLQPNVDAVLCAIVKNVTGFWDDRSCNNLFRFICMRVLTQLPTSTEESTPNTTSTVSTTPITKQSSTSRSTTQLNNIVTSTSTYSGLAATSTTHKENQMGKRENGSGMKIGIPTGTVVVLLAVALIAGLMYRRRRLTPISTSDSDTPTRTTIPDPHVSGEYNYVRSTSNHREPAIYENTGVTGGENSSPTAQYENVDTSRRNSVMHNTYASLTGSRNNDNHDYEAVGHDAISADVVR